MTDQEIEKMINDTLRKMYKKCKEHGALWKNFDSFLTWQKMYFFDEHLRLLALSKGDDEK